MAESFGQYLLNETIPSKYRPEGAYTKKKMFNNMLRLAKDDPDKYVQTIQRVKELGDEFATMEGISVGLDDIEPVYSQRDAIVKPALQKMKQTTDRSKRQQIVSQTQDKLIDYAKNHPGTMGDMVRSGGRGNPLQLMRTVGAPAAASDEEDEIQPWLTTHSYSEGLKPSEWWATNKEARMAAVKANIEVSEPGDLSKILVNNTSDQIVTETDCGTTNGLKFSVTDSSLVDRYTAKKTGNIPAGTLITPRILSSLKKQKIDSVLARSPMTCESRDGLCQMCAGLDVTGKPNAIGTNVGVRASQAMGEPLTQLALNVKHGGRVSGSNPMEIAGLEGFRAIIESPASFRNKAALAPESGTVEKVDAAPQGGHYITVGGQKTYAGQHLKPLVKPGDKVEAGDALSEGIPRPDEVVKHKGLGAGREYMVDKLSKIYQDSGIDIDRRHFETLAKSNLNHLRVEDVDDMDSAEHGLVRGDVIDYNKFRNIVSNSVETVPLSQAEGRYLGEAILHHLAGTKITPRMVSDFKKAGINRIKVTTRMPKVTPFMAPATRNPLLNPDWLVRMGHRYLKQSITEGAQKGEASDLHGAHPIPGIVFSAQFGEGDSGHY